MGKRFLRYLTLPSSAEVVAKAAKTINGENLQIIAERGTKDEDWYLPDTICEELDREACLFLCRLLAILCWMIHFVRACKKPSSHHLVRHWIGIRL